MNVFFDIVGIVVLLSSSVIVSDNQKGIRQEQTKAFHKGNLSLSSLSPKSAFLCTGSLPFLGEKPFAASNCLPWPWPGKPNSQIKSPTTNLRLDW